MLLEYQKIADAIVAEGKGYLPHGSDIVSGEAAVSRRLHRVVGGHGYLSGSGSESGSVSFFTAPRTSHNGTGGFDPDTDSDPDPGHVLPPAFRFLPSPSLCERSGYPVRYSATDQPVVGASFLEHLDQDAGQPVNRRGGKVSKSLHES